MIKAKVLRAFREGDSDKAKAYKVGEVIDLKETYFDKLKKSGFVERIVVDQAAEVKKLTAENTKLTARVAELEAQVKKLTAVDESFNTDDKSAKDDKAEDDKSAKGKKETK